MEDLAGSSHPAVAVDILVVGLDSTTRDTLLVADRKRLKVVVQNPKFTYHAADSNCLLVGVGERRCLDDSRQISVYISIFRSSALL